jgi:hypothetical protein
MLVVALVFAAIPVLALFLAFVTALIVSGFPSWLPLHSAAFAGGAGACLRWRGFLGEAKGIGQIQGIGNLSQ